MFNKSIIGSARFLKMPIDSQNLYFHLGMYADDDGVVEAFPIMKLTNSSEDNLRVLVSKGFIKVLNDDLVSFITDWQEHNLIRADRKVNSIYRDLLLKIVPEVELLEPRKRADVEKRRINGRPMDDQCPHRLGEDSIGEDSIGEDNESKEETPSQKMIKFINSDLKEYSDKFNCPISELEKFRSYWTEPNKSGTKTRWQLEKTFDLDRRVKTWLDRANQYSKEKRSEKTGKYSGL
jgi:hypothetical protein